MKDSDIKKLTVYMQKYFTSGKVLLKKRSGLEDSVELYSDEEFIGLMFVDDDDPKDISFSFQMSILASDLE